MIINRLDIKPISVNRLYKGRRFKTDEYKSYQAQWLQIKKEVIEAERIDLYIAFYVSDIRSDLDNCLKAAIDMMQKRHGFNDMQIARIGADKVIVEKGKEGIFYHLRELK